MSCVWCVIKVTDRNMGGWNPFITTGLGALQSVGVCRTHRGGGGVRLVIKATA